LEVCGSVERGEGQIEISEVEENFTSGALSRILDFDVF
jgi:hypothetical protein